MLHLLGDFVSQTPYRGFAPGPLARPPPREPPIAKSWVRLWFRMIRPPLNSELACVFGLLSIIGSATPRTSRFVELRSASNATTQVRAAEQGGRAACRSASDNWRLKKPTASLDSPRRQRKPVTAFVSCKQYRRGKKRGERFQDPLLFPFPRASSLFSFIQNLQF